MGNIGDGEVFTRTLRWIIATALVVRGSVFVWEILYPLSFSSTLQNFQDFYGYYASQLTLLGQGHIPYRDFPYTYPPFFLYLLYPFHAISMNAAGIPIVAADALSAPIVYL